MLDGAARLPDLFAEAARQGMPALAMTDHGNLFGAYDFYKGATRARAQADHRHRGLLRPAGPLRAPTVRLRRRLRRGQPGGHRRSEISTGGRGRGKHYTHMTLWAENTDGLRNLFRLSSLASLEGYYCKPRIDRELLAALRHGAHRHHRLPVRRGQTWLQAGNYDRALRGRRRVPRHLRRGQLLLRADGPRPRHRAPGPRGPAARSPARSTCRRWPPTTCTTCTPPTPTRHEVLLCIGTGTTMADPKRFKFDARDFYLKSAAEMRAVWDASCPRRATTRC